MPYDKGTSPHRWSALLLLINQIEVPPLNVTVLLLYSQTVIHQKIMKALHSAKPFSNRYNVRITFLYRRQQQAVCRL